MLDTAKKIGYLGLGILSITRERAEKLVDDLVARGEVAPRDAGKIVDDLVARGEEERKKLDQHIDEHLRRMTGRLGLATDTAVGELQAEVAALKAELAALKERLAALEAGRGDTGQGR